MVVQRVADTARASASTSIFESNAKTRWNMEEGGGGWRSNNIWRQSVDTSFRQSELATVGGCAHQCGRSSTGSSSEPSWETLSRSVYANGFDSNVVEKRRPTPCFFW